MGVCYPVHVCDQIRSTVFLIESEVLVSKMNILFFLRNLIFYFKKNEIGYKIYHFFSQFQNCTKFDHNDFLNVKQLFISSIKFPSDESVHRNIT